jgi:hypothetical protein
LALFAARFSAIDFAGFFFVSFRWFWPLPMGCPPYVEVWAWCFEFRGMVANLRQKVQGLLFY